MPWALQKIINIVPNHCMRKKECLKLVKLLIVVMTTLTTCGNNNNLTFSLHNIEDPHNTKAKERGCKKCLQ